MNTPNTNNSDFSTVSNRSNMHVEASTDNTMETFQHEFHEALSGPKIHTPEQDEFGTDSLIDAKSDLIEGEDAQRLLSKMAALSHPTYRDKDTAVGSAADTEPLSFMGDDMVFTEPDTEGVSVENKILNPEDEYVLIDLLKHDVGYERTYGREFQLDHALNIVNNHPGLIPVVYANEYGKVFRENPIFEALLRTGKKMVRVKVVPGLEDHVRMHLMVVSYNLGTGKLLSQVAKEIQLMRKVFVKMQGSKQYKNAKNENYSALKVIATAIGISPTKVHKIETIDRLCPAFFPRIDGSERTANGKFSINSAYKHCKGYEVAITEDPQGSLAQHKELMASPTNLLTLDKLFQIEKKKKDFNVNLDAEEVDVKPRVRYNFSELSHEATDEDVFKAYLKHHFPSFDENHRLYSKLLTKFRKVVNQIITDLA